MKKISFIVAFFFLFLSNCFAQTLNYRTNLLTDYFYSYQNKKEMMIQYTNNENEKLLYTIDARQSFDYDTDYEKIRNDFFIQDESIQNKIKKYIYFTQEQKDMITQIRYYIVTQNLIWKTFHPDLEFTIHNQELEIYQKEMEEQIELVPNWIQNYEVEDELILEKQNNYKLTSKDCQIKEEKDKWIIHGCTLNAKIKVEEMGKEDFYFYQNDRKLIGIESGFSPCTWTFSITKKIPEKKPTVENENISTDPSIKEESEKTTVKKTEELKRFPIQNVPNTKEDSFLLESILILLILCLKKFI